MYTERPRPGKSSKITKSCNAPNSVHETPATGALLASPPIPLPSTTPEPAHMSFVTPEVNVTSAMVLGDTHTFLDI